MTERRRPATRSKSRTRARLFGAPSPGRFVETPEGQALAQSAEIHYAAKAEQNRLLALEKLALDVFYDPMAARAFAVNPDEYLRQGGFPGVRLDLNSKEIRIAMAVGDPLVREAARRGDVLGFLDAVRAQGIEPDLPPRLGAVFGIELLVYASALAISWVAVGYSVAAAVNFETAIGVHHEVAVSGGDVYAVEHHKDAISAIAEHIGDPEFVEAVRSESMARMIQEYVILHRRALGLETDELEVEIRPEP